VVQAQVGRGKLILTTFDFTNYGEDAYATYFLDSLIDYCVNTQYIPRLSMPVSG
jgi:hypothetical protein